MSKITTIIVDDEKKSRDGLKKLLDPIDIFEVVAICKDGVEAIEQIDQLQPNLVLLDIQMPGINGFDVLKSVAHRPFIIFITAYDAYALKAFDVHALDYLLKPFTDERFNEALVNAKERILSKSLDLTIQNLSKLIEEISPDSSNEAILSTVTEKKFVIRSEGKILLVNYHDITWFEAFDYYAKVHEKQTHLIRNSLKNLETTLPPFFVRVHKSAIINLNHIQSMEPLDHSELIAYLSDGSEVKVSRTYKDQLMNRLSS